MSTQSITELAAAFLALPAGDRLELLTALGLQPARHELTRARDDAIRELGTRMTDVASGRELARRIYGELTRYAATSWRFERTRSKDRPDALRATMRTVLRCNNGRVPGHTTIRNVLAGISR